MMHGLEYVLARDLGTFADPGTGTGPQELRGTKGRQHVGSGVAARGLPFTEPMALGLIE